MHRDNKENIKIDFYVITRILANFDIKKIISIERINSSGNFTFLIKTMSNSFILRLSQSTGHRSRSKNELLAELELIEYLRNNSFPTPKLIYDKNGKALIEYKNHFGFLREFVDAEEKQTPDVNEIIKAGEILARLHNLTEHFKSNHKREHAWDVKETRKNFFNIKNDILKSTFPNKQDFVRKFETEIDSIKLPDNIPFGIIHEDFGKRHVLWNNSEIQAVIDFDRCYKAQFVLDVGQACRGWCFNNWKTWDNQKFLAFLHGYQGQRTLTKKEKQALPDSIKFAVLERALSFCLKYVLAGGTQEDADFSWSSLSDDGLLGQIKLNEKTILKSLNVI